MTDAERKEQGARVIEKMLGSQAEAVRQNWREICPDFEEYVVRLVAGDFWSRPGLDMRTKSLATIAALAAQGRTLALELNIRMALNNGATRKDVVETLLHIAPYAGFPACWEGLALARKVFDAASA